MAAKFDLDNDMVGLLDEFKVVEATRKVLRENSVLDLGSLESLTEEDLKDIGLPSLYMVKRFVRDIIPSIPEYRVSAQQRKDEEEAHEKQRRDEQRLATQRQVRARSFTFTLAITLILP